MKIGDKLWDRVSYFPLIFIQVEVVGETSRSWIVGKPNHEYGRLKLPKNNPFVKGNIFTCIERNELVWSNAYKPIIIDHIKQLKDIDILRQVADLIGCKYD